MSIFMDKGAAPTQNDLKTGLGPEAFELWQALAGYVKSRYPRATEEWKFPGAKYGWSFRLNDRKRVIIYMIPMDRYFEVAFVFGQKATEEVLASDVDERIKTDLQNARAYAEGRGIRISMKDATFLNDVKTLVGIKIST